MFWNFVNRYENGPLQRDPVCDEASLFHNEMAPLLHVKISLLYQRKGMRLFIIIFVGDTRFKILRTNMKNLSLRFL